MTFQEQEHRDKLLTDYDSNIRDSSVTVTFSGTTRCHLYNCVSSDTLIFVVILHCTVSVQQETLLTVHYIKKGSCESKWAAIAIFCKLTNDFNTDSSPQSWDFTQFINQSNHTHSSRSSLVMKALIERGIKRMSVQCTDDKWVSHEMTEAKRSVTFKSLQKPFNLLQKANMLEI